ncbi:hypothetical protein QYF68_26830 [Mycolicibacterium austroafricanum]|uniref:Peptidase n=1 Tax=Mycolicibacterium austroafricanum TaxID=39687 RepID=A0ABT8HKX7_MYCAO|nr:hypothetical protein [Mycolicibacterium austroafricanum]MDN4521410.1 hypothetical protein [Mycolicibacterium austroafricanum]
MTVALYVKVFDGIVLAADSATTMKLDTPNGTVYQVYNNADKIFHLHRRLPVAGMTWGMGRVGPASISSLSKSLRLQLMGRDPGYSEEPLDIDNFTVKDVAERASRMFARAAADAKITSWPDLPDDPLGYLVSGISSDCDQAEAWLLMFQGKEMEPEPQQILNDGSYGFQPFAQPAAVNRLFNGYDDNLYEALITNTTVAKVQASTAQNPVDPVKARKEAEAEVDAWLRPLRVDPVPPAMPLPDAIDLARFMVETTEGYARYGFGPDTVGGQVEVASISPHEGFKWINRKHYFTPALNPGEQP